LKVWFLLLLAVVCSPAYAMVEGKVEPQVGVVSLDYQWFRVGSDTGRSYNYFLEYGLDEGTGIVLCYNRLCSGSDRVSLGGAYAKVELHESRRGLSHSAVYGGFQSRHLTSPGAGVNLTGFQFGLVTDGSITGGIRGLGRIGADIYEDDTFLELELGTGIRLSSFAELQGGYRSIVSLRAQGANTVDGLFVGLSVPLGRRPPLHW